MNLQHDTKLLSLVKERRKKQVWGRWWKRQEIQMQGRKHRRCWLYMVWYLIGEQGRRVCGSWSEWTFKGQRKQEQCGGYVRIMQEKNDDEVCVRLLHRKRNKVQILSAWIGGQKKGSRSDENKNEERGVRTSERPLGLTILNFGYERLRKCIGIQKRWQIITKQAGEKGLISRI